MIGEVDADGLATLIVDRDWRKVLVCSACAVVLHKGRVVLAGASGEVAARPELAGHLGV